MCDFKRVIKQIFGTYYASQLAKIFYKIPNALLAFFPMRDEILLESNPDLTCNTYELYRYFLQKGLNRKFRLVWRVDFPEKYENDVPPNVYYIEKNPKGINKIRNYVRCYLARVSISCNTNLPRYKTSRRQLNIYLDHGSQLKSMKGKDGKKAPLSCDYLISQSSFFVKYHLDEYTIKTEQIVCTGLPRDDQFFRKYNSLSKLVTNVDSYHKVIIWAPTFRAHKNGYRIDCHSKSAYGLPILRNSLDILQLKSVLEKENILLIIKPHPAQDMTKLKVESNNNVKVISNEELCDCCIQINELLAQTDALITDYSSIYYDYLFTEKPIALAIDDLTEYQNEKGFVFENPLSILKGDIVRTTDDLCKFIISVSEENDNTLEERKNIQKMINDYDDGNASERVYNFIMSKVDC
ncbi:MAG TPA: hypothetical protein DGH14_10420 [Roseburia sp.]|nr:hypothetical protein [Roseburia sp.]